MEAVANVIAGFAVALTGQQVILPLFGVQLSIAGHMGVAALFTLLSLMRSYLLRRLFDHLDHLRREEEKARQERLRQAFSPDGRLCRSQTNAQPGHHPGDLPESIGSWHDRRR